MTKPLEGTEKGRSRNFSSKRPSNFSQGTAINDLVLITFCLCVSSLKTKISQEVDSDQHRLCMLLHLHTMNQSLQPGRWILMIGPASVTGPPTHTSRWRDCHKEKRWADQEPLQHPLLSQKFFCLKEHFPQDYKGREYLYFSHRVQMKLWTQNSLIFSFNYFTASLSPGSFIFIFYFIV